MTTLHLGGYTSDRPDSGLGTVAWEAGLGTATPLGGPQDPSWLVPVPGSDNGQVYAVAEGPGEVALVDGSGAVVSSTPCGGEGPCHLALSPDGAWLAVSNYVSGTVGLVRVTGDALELADTLALEGSGPHERQDGPHAHQATWLDDARLLVCDLGADRIHEVSVEGSGELRHTGEIELPAGTGPRHLALHPTRDDLGWVVGELARTVHVLRRTDDGWSAADPVSTTPHGPAEGETTAAGIVVGPEGDQVLVSTRGTDTVSVFGTDDDGALELVQHLGVATWPRFIGWLPGAEGEVLLVAAERADVVHAHRREDGRLGEPFATLTWAAPTWIG